MDAVLNRSHALLAAVAAALLVVSGGATGIAGIIMAFGGHVSAVNITAWTAAGSAAALGFSKVVDSFHNAYVSRKTAPVVVTAAAPPAPTAVVDASVIRAIGAALSSYGGTTP